MDRVISFQEKIKEILQIQKEHPISPENLQKHLVIDADENEFVLLAFGWHDEIYSHNLLFHVEIVDDKVWIHQNNTDVDIEEQFVEAGIPESKIIIGFVDPLLRNAS